MHVDAQDAIKVQTEPINIQDIPHSLTAEKQSGKTPKKTQIKNLANCELEEFLSQTNKIRHAVEKWLTDTDIMNIRKRLPDIVDGASKEETDKARFEQAKKNISDMLDAVLSEHPKETAEILAMCCFVEPQDIKKHKTSEFLKAFGELIEDEAVISFFLSLVRLARTRISKG